MSEPTKQEKKPISIASALPNTFIQISGARTRVHAWAITSEGYVEPLVENLCGMLMLVPDDLLVEAGAPFVREST